MGNTPSGLSPKTDCYNIVVDINRISDVSSTGWNVILQDELSEKLLTAQSDEEAFKTLHLNQTKTIVAVLGLFNRGKTFVLNHLADKRLPSDKKIHTKGLSFLEGSLLYYVLTNF